VQHPGRTRTAALAATLVAASAALAGCEVTLAEPPATPPPTLVEPTAPGTAPPAAGEPVVDVVEGTALAALDTLEVKGRAPRTGYSRDEFGPRWADTDRNGCDTRNDILRRDLDDVELRPGTRDCVVLSGTLAEPYSGEPVQFLRGQGTSSLVQIDHVVALSDAWQKGAQQWTPERRLAFANDPLNLLAVDGTLNQRKGDGDAATWLPPNKGFRCEYVARQVAVKAKYGAWVTVAERDAVAGVLKDCPEQPLPVSEHPVEVG